MKNAQPAPKDIDEYIARFPRGVGAMLERIRATIRKAAPKATEAIKYRMPAFVLNGNLIYFAAYQKHIGLYPAPRESAEFKRELAAYRGTKNSVSFPLDQPIPVDLVRRIVRYRVKVVSARAATKK